MHCTGLQQLQIYVSTDDRCFAKTKEFQNLKYCVRNKGFLEHLKAFLYPKVHEISLFGLLLGHRCHWCQRARIWSNVIVS